MIEDKATEKWKERAKKLGLIVNMGADNPQPKQGPSPKTKAASAKVSKNKSGKK